MHRVDVDAERVPFGFARAYAKTAPFDMLSKADVNLQCVLERKSQDAVWTTRGAIALAHIELKGFFLLISIFQLFYLICFVL